MKGPSSDAFGGQGYLILGITWAEAALATIVVAARTHSSCELVARKGWDLFWVLVAWLISFIAQGFITGSVAYGSGNHIEALTAHDIIEAEKWSWIGQMIAILAIGFGKIAVIALLLRIQGPDHRRKAYFLHFIWISNTIINVAQIVLILKQCEPQEKLWDVSLEGNCEFRITTSQVGFFQGSWAAASDIVLATYPITVFWDLKMSWQKKLGLCALLGGGYFAAIATIVKTVHIKLITTTTDVTFAVYPLLIWAFTEMWLIIILGSVPSLRIYFVKLSKRAKSFFGWRKAFETEHFSDSATVRLNTTRTPGSKEKDSQFHRHYEHRPTENGSDDSMLADECGIVVQREYCVTYEVNDHEQKHEV